MRRFRTWEWPLLCRSVHARSGRPVVPCCHAAPALLLPCPGMWGYWSTDGLGLFEYMLLAEELGAVPVWVVNNGGWVGGWVGGWQEAGSVLSSPRQLHAVGVLCCQSLLRHCSPSSPPLPPAPPFCQA